MHAPGVSFIAFRPRGHVLSEFLHKAWRSQLRIDLAWLGHACVQPAGCKRRFRFSVDKLQLAGTAVVAATRLEESQAIFRKQERKKIPGAIKHH